MDEKIAFLNGFLKEELYMMQPEGFVDPKGANVGKRSMQFQKNCTLTQDLCRRCIETRGGECVYVPS